MKRFKLSTKVLIVVIPLFSLTFGIIIFLNYRFEERQTLELARLAADAQASIIKKSLVHMMTTQYEIDDRYLAQIIRPGELENVRVLFRFDSLRLDPTLLKPERIPILRDRESKLKELWTDQIETVFATGDSLWVITCDVSRHVYPMDRHTDFEVQSLSAGIPVRFWTCARLRIVLPFRAESKCQQCHDVPEVYVLGAATMEMPFGQPVSAIRSNAARSLVIFVVLTLVGTVLGIFIFRKFVGAPIQRLVEATEIVGTGNLSHRMVEEFGKDELGQLAASFEEMQDKLKQAQGALLKKERLSTIGQMASSIIHDFRNPLTNISLGISMLESDASMSPERRQLLFEQVRDGIHRITQMTQELLDFSRGDARLDRRPVNVSDVAGEIASSVEGDLSNRRIRLNLVVESRRVCYLDKERLQRALINLINNAEDAMPNGGEVLLRVSEEDNAIVFSVTDSGQGIPMEIRETLFEPFVTTGKPNGTGLGLAITRKLVEQHGGRVEFETRIGTGTIFRVRIPVEQPAAA